MVVERRARLHAKMRVHDLEWILEAARKARELSRKSASSAAADAIALVVERTESLLSIAKGDLHVEEDLSTKPRVVEKSEPPPEVLPEKKVTLHEFVRDPHNTLTGHCSCGWPSLPRSVEHEGRTHVVQDVRLKKSWNMHARQMRKRGEEVRS